MLYEMPAWTLSVNKNAMMNKKEVGDIFGLSATNTTRTLSTRGVEFSQLGRKHYFKMGDIRKLVDKMNIGEEAPFYNEGRFEGLKVVNVNELSSLGDFVPMNYIVDGCGQNKINIRNHIYKKMICAVIMNDQILIKKKDADNYINLFKSGLIANKHKK